VHPKSQLDWLNLPLTNIAAATDCQMMHASKYQILLITFHSIQKPLSPKQYKPLQASFARIK